MADVYWTGLFLKENFVRGAGCQGFDQTMFWQAPKVD